MKGNTLRPLRYIFHSLPKTVDITLAKHIKEEWGDIVKKSPYGHSYYNAEKTWSYTKDGSYRLSDHWNFRSKGVTHCKTDTPVLNDTH